MLLSSLSSFTLFADIGCQVNIVGIRWLTRCCFRGRLRCVFFLIWTFEVRDGAVYYVICVCLDVFARREAVAGGW